MSPMKPFWSKPLKTVPSLATSCVQVGTHVGASPPTAPWRATGSLIEGQARSADASRLARAASTLSRPPASNAAGTRTLLLYLHVAGSEEAIKTPAPTPTHKVLS